MKIRIILQKGFYPIMSSFYDAWWWWTMTWHWQPVGYVCTFQSCRNRRARGAIAHPNFGRSVNPISARGGQVMPTTFLPAPRPRIFRPSYGPDCTWLYLPHHLQRKNAAGRLVLINSRPHSTVRDCGSK